MQTNTSNHLQNYNEKDVLFTTSQTNFLPQLVGIIGPTTPDYLNLHCDYCLNKLLLSVICYQNKSAMRHLNMSTRFI